MDIFERLDKTIPWSETEQIVIDAVSRLAREKIMPRAAGHDEAGSFPWDNVADINLLELNRVFIPEEYEGSGLSYSTYLACCREIAQACASTAIVWATNFHACGPVVDFASHEQKMRWLPPIANGGLAALAITEPGAGSDATGMKTRFRPDGDDIIVDGAKVFITNGDVCEWLLLFGKWSELGDGRDAISIAVVEKGTPGFEVERLEKKMGHRASSTAALSFNGCRIPRANLLGKPGEGLSMLFHFLNRSRPSIAAHALGIARAAFQEATDYINERRQSGRRIVEFQGIQFMLADLATDLAMCERWLWHVAARIEAGDNNIAQESSMLKLRASDVAMRVTTEAVQLLGGYGYTQDFKVERLMRDAKITQIWEGTNQVHRQIIGRSFMKK
ncbi:acyl-CoA dehydrogenase family protein [Ancylobacter polymorphus]|uniref:3-sulfinopropanoyl-CoA desulfinase n=1 Tax=Ancylobacter polymorphus TaxID=223390 RepID=A0A9E7A5P7_9HYPH|nr:acyl-CoA dehydrogenase family protein [Ancylobacter polymorphus]UOK73318.1 acyl-CoA dehydrogenase family protein [Ancylobacter polymorphus]